MKVAIGLWALIFGALSFGSKQDEGIYGKRLGGPLPNLNNQEAKVFHDGWKSFTRIWVPNGEGALFNAASCANCHSEPTYGGGSASSFNHVFFVPDKKDMSGFVTFPWQIQHIGRPSGSRFPKGDFETRRPPMLYGNGLLEAVPLSTIQAMADPSDKNKDGISGRILTDGKAFGRFGWKASVPDLPTFVKNAFAIELGLPIGGGEGITHLTDEKVQQCLDVVRLFAPPAPLPLSDQAVAGKRVFMEVGCASCHAPTLKTGDSTYAALSNRTFEAYTDLLVHDLGRGKAKLTTSGPATLNEYRTAPLWGLRHFAKYLFHDGGCKDITEAIDRHEGEAQSVHEAWVKLKPAEKAALQAFLESL